MCIISWRQFTTAEDGSPAQSAELEPLPMSQVGFEVNVLRNFSMSFSFNRIYDRYILDTEGPRGLFKGLGPTVVGVAPSRAIYFSAYSQSKRFYNDYLPPNSPLVHICSAGTAGTIFVTTSEKFGFMDIFISRYHRMYNHKSRVVCKNAPSAWPKVGKMVKIGIDSLYLTGLQERSEFHCDAMRLTYLSHKRTSWIL